MCIACMLVGEAISVYGTAIQQPISLGQPTYTHYKVGMFTEARPPTSSMKESAIVLSQCVLPWVGVAGKGER